MSFRTAFLVIGGLAVAGATLPAHADPCGMVPPLIVPANQVAIERVGAQKTFVMHYKGVETMVLRPGFKGKIDEFGMLIPFPSPPAIRKVDEDIFSHVAASIEPPEVIARVWRNNRRSRMDAPSATGGAVAAESAPRDEERLSYNTVRVINREAVGMYDVAVLEAGSTKALKRWMTSNDFRYPTGMEDVTEDYVKSRWVFVAIKTQVGAKDGVNPRPGMRKAKAKLPPKAEFTGNVQAMGFRFKTKDLVVPMRLSAFNAGKLRNIVYVMTDEPSQIDRIPSRYVVRQLSGKQLYRNLTSPLPLRVIGGTYDQLQPFQKQQLKATRNSEPHLGEAKNLFASDLLAIRTGKLSNAFEESEKELLAIGERLELRGNKIDQLHSGELSTKKKRAVVKALRDVKRLSLTVVDGEFKRETIAAANLSFSKYAMPKRRNNKKNYDATKAGPGFVNTQGKVYYSSIDTLDRIQKVRERMQHMELDGDSNDRWFVGGGIGMGLFLMIGLVAYRRRGRHDDVLSSAASRVGSGLALALALGFGGLVATSGVASAQSDTSSLVKQLSDGKMAQSAVNRLVKKGQNAVDPLLDFVADSEKTSARGWAIAALGEIGGADAIKGLQQIYNNTGEKMLVRTWAAAAHIGATKTADELLAISQLANQFPATARPMGKQLARHLSRSKNNSAEALLGAVSRVPQLRTELMTAVTALPTKSVIDAMVTSKDVNVRRMAAATLGTLATQRKGVQNSVLRAYRFKARAKDVPWKGGALFLPAFQWNKAQGTQLVSNLLRWHLWADIRGRSDLQQQIHNNLRSVQLIRAVGYQNPGWQQKSTVDWLVIWGKFAGDSSVRDMLRQQRVANQRRYRSALDRI